jgi:phage-related protein
VREGAVALAAGDHVVLGRDAAPNDVGLLAHEVAHVLQQGHLGSGVGWTGAQLEAEAVAASGAAWRGETFQVRGEAAQLHIQRADEEESPGLIESLILDAVKKYAPDLVPIIQHGPLAWIEDKLNTAIDAVFDAVTAPVRAASGVVQALEAHFGDLVAWMREAAVKIAAGDCKPLTEAAEKIEQVITGLAAPVVERIKELAGKAKDFFTGLWDRFGAPAWEFLKRLGGAAWERLQALAHLVWDKTAPVRETISSAWTWLKNKLGIGEGPEGQDGILQWVQRRAEQVWDEKIKPFVERFRKPLMVIGGILLLLSPAGPIIAIGAGVAGLIAGIRWIKQNMTSRDGVVNQRDFLRGTILPGIMNAVGAVSGALSRAAGFVLEKLSGVMASLGEVVGAVAGSIFRVAVAIVQWVADQFRALVQWATDKLKGLADLVAAGLDKLKRFLEPLFSLLGEIAGVFVDLLKLPLMLVGRLWRLIPACIRNPFVDFFVNQILKRIPIFKDLLDLLELWAQIQAEVMAIIRQIFVDHDLMGALKATFRLIVKVLKIPLDLAVTVLAKAATAWDAVLAKPLEFIKNILRAMRVGFGSFFGNILSHLAFGIQGWLFGALKEQQIQPPASWTDIWAIFRLVAQILGLTQRHIFELIGKRVGPAIAAKLETAWNVLTGVWSWVVEAVKDPASIGKHVMERLRDLGKLVLDAAIGWIVENVIKQVTKRLLSLLDPTGVMAVVNALLALYSAVKSAIQYAAAILGILNRILDTVLDLTAGVVAGAAKALEDALHMAMPVIIGFLANFLNLGGVGAKLREIVASIRERVDAAILWLIDQALKVGRAILDALGLGGRPGGTHQRAFQFMGHTHQLRLDVTGDTASLNVASSEFAEFSVKIRGVRQHYATRLGAQADTNLLARLDALIARISAAGRQLNAQLAVTRRQAAARPGQQSGVDDVLDQFDTVINDAGIEMTEIGQRIVQTLYPKVPQLQVGSQVIVQPNDTVWQIESHADIGKAKSETKDMLEPEGAVTSSTDLEFQMTVREITATGLGVTRKFPYSKYVEAGKSFTDGWQEYTGSADRYHTTGNLVRSAFFGGGQWRKTFYPDFLSEHETWRQREIATAATRAQSELGSASPLAPALQSFKAANNPRDSDLMLIVWRDRPGGSVNYTPWSKTRSTGEELPIDHIRPVADHWNVEGYDTTQPPRVKFYRDSSNHQILDRVSNSRKSGPDAVNKVGRNFFGPPR